MLSIGLDIVTYDIRKLQLNRNNLIAKNWSVYWFGMLHRQKLNDRLTEWLTDKLFCWKLTFIAIKDLSVICGDGRRDIWLWQEDVPHFDGGGRLRREPLDAALDAVLYESDHVQEFCVVNLK